MSRLLPFPLLITFLLTACAPASTPASTQRPTNTPVPTRVQSTATIPQPTPFPVSTATISQPTALDGLRMVYVVDDNLYIQDGDSPLFQLTHDEGRDRNPVFSDDGEKIVFLRGFLPHDLYSINPDGSDEQLLVSGSELSALGLGYDELSELRSFAFIPGTHQLVFDTRELDEDDVKMQDWQRLSSTNNNDLLLVDADTAEIKRILAPGQGGNFVVSPNGKMIAVQGRGYINLVDLNGQMIRQNLLTYIPTQPYVLDSGIFWNEDATELIVTLPIETEYNMGGPETRSIWHIAIDGSSRTQVSFDPSVLATDYTISPDGNWILYNYYYYPGKTEESITSGLYLGNLLEGDSHLYSEGISPSSWSIDSLHFLYEAQGLFLASPSKQPEQIADKGHILGWIDARHFLYYSGKIITIRGLDKSIVNFSYPPSLYLGETTFTYIYKSAP